MKASCIREGQINIYPSHLHSSDDCATLVQTQRDASKQKTVKFNAVLKSNIKIECDLFT